MRRLAKQAINIFLLSVFFLCETFASETSDTSQIVAAVGKKEISFGEFLGRYEDYLIWTGAADNIQVRYAILNNMINEILLREYDDNSKVYSNPEYNKEIKAAWNETVLSFLKDREVYAAITVTDQEVKRAYQRSKIKLAVRHLFAPNKKEAENIYHLVTMGVSFQELAKQVFTDTTLRNNGGYLGYITWGQTDPNFENAAYSLKVGEVSKPIKTAQGYSIIRVDDRIEDPLVTENEFLNMKRKIERALKIDKKKPYEEAYLNRVFDKNRLIINDACVRTIFDDLADGNAHDFEFKPQRDKENKVCVKYGKRKYTVKEIELKLLNTPEYDRALLKNVSDVKNGIQALVMQDVLLRIAKKKGYDTTSDVADTYAKLANDIYLRYKRQEVLDLVPVNDSEITKYYNANIAYYKEENEINVQEIIVDNDSVSLAIKNKIAHGEDFGSLAKKYSLRTWSANNGGIMGFSPMSSFGKLKDSLWNSEIGQVIGPMTFDRYFGLFRVLGKQEGKPISIAFVRGKIVSAIKNEKGFPYMEKKLEALSQKTSIKINNDLLKNYTLDLKTAG
jgi:parvulin-like peptidyl-prolyl isomerase